MELSAHIERCPRDAFVTINLSDDDGDLIPVSIDIARGDLIVSAVRRVILENDLPDHLIDALVETVSALVRDLGEKTDTKNDPEGIDNINADVDVNEAVNELVGTYYRFTASYNTSIKEPVFPKAYHTLASSPLPTLFDRLLLHERRLAERVDELWNQRLFALRDLQRRHAEEVESAQLKPSGQSGLGMTQILGKHVEYN
ncbi:hypothetical protein M427DRAFT_388564 [Gonapodya prolifera JEL478]|uniref:Uncharacterized protein n=1 Tax=Gonapodya prolifera (strain JEL478) TaxID=1344416 RepID=A0A139A7W2_GONPJ|nr:hypothetical protein M427DRAFT_388564 [Gonapodya prolifera JEL478]|eukprot:KXS12794.1 hypothetical protein M427DRAFT_388564 [Gonapodya prolifera JEL478]